RSARMRSGKSGYAAHDSRTTKRTSITALPTKNPVTLGDDQPNATTFVHAYTSAASPPVTSNAASMSKVGRDRDLDGASTIEPPTAAMSAMGRFASRHQRHERY